MPVQIPGENTGLFGASLHFVFQAVFAQQREVFCGAQGRKGAAVCQQSKCVVSHLTSHLRSGLIGINLHLRAQIPWVA